MKDDPFEVYWEYDSHNDIVIIDYKKEECNKCHELEYCARIQIHLDLEFGIQFFLCSLCICGLERLCMQSGKEQLIKFMHSCGFDWICDVAYKNGHELVASKAPDSDEIWWRPLEVEGSGFTQLFKGSVRNLYKI